MHLNGLRNCLNLYLQMFALYVFILCSCFTLFCIGDISTDINMDIHICQEKYPP